MISILQTGKYSSFSILKTNKLFMYGICNLDKVILIIELKLSFEMNLEECKILK